MTDQDTLARRQLIRHHGEHRLSDCLTDAAPEMLAALKMVTNPAISFATSMAVAHAAIAKAEGRA